MNPDKNKVRFWGVDLHSRLRRRVFVVAHYGALLVALRAIVEAGAVYPVLQMRHSGFWLMRVGNYLFPAEGEASQQMDAAELAEKGRAFSGALTALAGFCFALAAIYGVSTMELSPDDLAAVFLGLGFVALTGAKAYVLWTAPDPRRLGAVETSVPGQV